MATPWPGRDAQAVIEGRPPGRLPAGIVTGIAAGLLFITQPDLGTTNGQFVSATFGATKVDT
jgi:hypothetical protein